MSWPLTGEVWSPATLSQDNTKGSRQEPWVAVSGASCARAGPASQSWCSVQSSALYWMGEGRAACQLVAYGFSFFKPFIQRVFTKLLYVRH